MVYLQCFDLPLSTSAGFQPSTVLAIFVKTLLGTNISPSQSTLEDDFSFPKVGYVIVPWRVWYAFIDLSIHLSSAQNPGWLFDIGGYTTQYIYMDCMGIIKSQHKDPYKPIAHGQHPNTIGRPQLLCAKPLMPFHWVARLIAYLCKVGNQKPLINGVKYIAPLNDRK